MSSRLYVRKIDIEKLKQRHDWEFLTKHELALEIVEQIGSPEIDFSE